MDIRPLVEEAVRRTNSGSYIIPNQDYGWLSNTIKDSERIRGEPVGSILFVGGVLYSAIAKHDNPQKRIAAVERDPLAIIAQLYSSWLISEGDTYESLVRHLLVPGEKCRFLGHYRTRRVREDSVISAETRFREFMRHNMVELAVPDMDSLFHRIYGVFRLKGGYWVRNIKKGLLPEIVRDVKGTDAPDRIICDDFVKMIHDERFDCIITNNVFEFSEKPDMFFESAAKSLKKKGILEVTLYNEPKSLLESRPKELSKLRLPKKVVGRHSIIKVSDGIAREIIKPLMAGRNYFLFQKH